MLKTNIFLKKKGEEAALEEGGAASEEGGVVSEEGGASSEEGGAASEEGGVVSAEGGAASEEGGAASEEGGVVSEVGGVVSEMGGGRLREREQENSEKVEPETGRNQKPGKVESEEPGRKKEDKKYGREGEEKGKDGSNIVQLVQQKLEGVVVHQKNSFNDGSRLNTAVIQGEGGGNKGGTRLGNITKKQGENMGKYKINRKYGKYTMEIQGTN